MPLWLRPFLELPLPARLGAGLAALVAVFVVLVFLARRLRLGNGVRAAATGLLLLSSSALGIQVYRLPPTRGHHFVIEHQVVRICAAVSTTLLAVMLLTYLVPAALDALQKGGFISFVAARHVRSKKSGFLTTISILSILGVAISSFALCAVISIMGGFGADLKAKILNNNAQIRVETTATGGFEYYREALDRVRLVPGVIGATPVASGEVMASSSTNTAGMIVHGVDTQTIGQVIDIPSKIEVGSFDFLENPEKLDELPEDAPIGLGPSGEYYLKGPGFEDTKPKTGALDALPGIVLGAELAKSLHVYVGDSLSLVSPMGELGPSGLLPKIRKFRVAGVFYSGMYEYDAAFAFVTLEKAQELLDLGHFVTSIDLRVSEVERADALLPSVKAAIERPDLGVRDWKEMNRNLFSALALEKIATFVVLSIAILVASFCIICTLLLMVTEKSKEISILKAMGSTDSSILRLFMLEGMFIGGVGTLFGVVTGFVSMSSLKNFGVRLDPEVYYVDRLPVTVQVGDYLWIALCAFLITTLATMYPAKAASQLKPVEGIRHE